MLPEKLRSSIYEDICKGYELLRVLDLFGTQLERLEAIDDYVINLLDDKRENLLSLKLRFVEKDFKVLETAYFKYKYPLSDESHPNARAFNHRTISKVDAENGSADEQKMQKLWRVDQIASIPFGGCGENSDPIGAILVTKKNGLISQDVFDAIQELAEVFYEPVKTALSYFYICERKDEFEHNSEEQQRFLEFICEFSNLTDLNEIYSLFSQELAHRFPFEVFSYYLLEDDKLVGKNVTIASEKYQDQHDIWEKSVVGVRYEANNPTNPIAHAFLLNRHLFFEDGHQIIEIAEKRQVKEQGAASEADIREQRVIHDNERTLLFVPIRHRRRPIGVCVLHSLSAIVHIGEHDLRLVEYLCTFLGAELSNAKNFAIQQEQHREIARLNALLQGQVDELAEQASTDQLTGLYNFRTFKSEIKRRLLLAQTTPAQGSLSIAIVDIDHFKKFNDTYGHAAGNVVLAGVAGEINKLVRKGDLACRYGGEEFVVLLQNCDVDGIKIFAERIRATVEGARFAVGDTQLAVTVSVGCATSAVGDSPESIFERADQALYQAKHNGRNRVEVKA
jgi:diguanylate cyclase (GGDEF)-like protein